MMTKIEPTGFSLPHSYFIEYLAGVTDKPSQEQNEH
jgi:hypothetical protein